MSEASQGPGWWLASDGKWYPPESQPAPPAPPAPPAKKDNPGCTRTMAGWTLLVVGVIALLVGFGWMNESHSTEHRYQGESHRIDCERDEAVAGRGFLASSADRACARSWDDRQAQRPWWIVGGVAGILVGVSLIYGSRKQPGG